MVTSVDTPACGGPLDQGIPVRVVACVVQVDVGIDELQT